MKLHDLKPSAGSKRKKIRVARGIAGRRGKTAGRGTKGQGARQGGGKGPYFEGGQLPLVRRIPFKRGFTNLFRIEYQEVNLWLLDRVFEGGEDVTPSTLAAKGLIRDAALPVAVLGSGDVTKKLNVKAHRFSKSAEEKLVKAGGTVEKVPVRITGPHATIRKLPRARMEKLYGTAE